MDWVTPGRLHRTVGRFLSSKKRPFAFYCFKKTSQAAEFYAKAKKNSTEFKIKIDWTRKKRSTSVVSVLTTHEVHANGRCAIVYEWFFSHPFFSPIKTIISPEHSARVKTGTKTGFTPHQPHTHTHTQRSQWRVWCLLNHDADRGAWARARAHSRAKSKLKLISSSLPPIPFPPTLSARCHFLTVSVSHSVIRVPSRITPRWIDEKWVPPPKSALHTLGTYPGVTFPTGFCSKTWRDS